MRRVDAASVTRRRSNGDCGVVEGPGLAGLLDDGSFLETGGVKNAAHAGHKRLAEANFGGLGFVARHFGVDEFTAEELIGG